jgi:hypothetical protein
MPCALEICDKLQRALERRFMTAVFKRAAGEILEKCHSQAAGTPCANIDTDTSGAPLSAAASWGGKRNSAGRVSETLSEHDARKLIAAARFARRIGLPLNQHITIHWEHAGVPDHEAGAATSRFLRLASQWIATRGGQFAYAWVRENGAGKGSHLHVLAHVPSGLSLGPMQRGWLRKITGSTYVSGTIMTKRVGGTRSAAETTPDFYLSNLAAVTGYQLKGASAAVVTQLGLLRPPQHGRLIGKRAGTSENLGPKARARVALSA